MLLLICALCLWAGSEAFAPRFRPLSQLSSRKFFSTVENEAAVVETAEERLVQVPEGVRELKAVTDDNFSEEVLAEGLHVVLFSSSWCAPCLEFKSKMQNSMMKHGSKAKFFVLDTDYSSEAVAEYSIRSIPSILLFRDGQQVSHIVGNVDIDVLNTQILKNF
jgi:thioredoxin 1